MNPKLKGLKSTLAKLDHAIDFHADKFGQKIEAAIAETEAGFMAAGQKLEAKISAEVRGTLKEVNDFMDAVGSMTGSNGTPTSGGSSESSESSVNDQQNNSAGQSKQPSASNPQASWQSDKKAE